MLLSIDIAHNASKVQTTIDLYCNSESAEDIEIGIQSEIRSISDYVAIDASSFAESEDGNTTVTGDDQKAVSTGASESGEDAIHSCDEP